jgi:hypothetical protein
LEIINQHVKPSDLVGVWKLVKYITVLNHSTEELYPYGENPKGYLIYTAEGFVSVNIMRGNRTLQSSSLEEKAEVSENFGGYAGRYTISGNTVTHYPEISGFLNYIEKPQTRHFQITDNLLTLEYNHALEEHSYRQTSQTRAHSQLIWQRILR